MSAHSNWASSQLGYEFANPELLSLALTHKSSAALNNERLEFLGDAVLDLVVADALFRDSPDLDEGSLSRLRASLVRSDTLTAIAQEINLGALLILGSGEKRSGGHQRASLMADALEAVFGAVYLDRGFAAATDVIRRVYGERLADLPSADELKDPKTRLQEELQQLGQVLPLYELVQESGPPHAPVFVVRCVLEVSGLTCRGQGSSRRKAEQQAAAAMLEQLAELQ